VTDILISPRAPRLDPRPVAHRIGLIALSTDHTTEVDFARILAPAGIGIYVARIPFANPVTPERLSAMGPNLAGGAELILPGEALDAIVYGCTSASVCIGDDVVRQQVARGKPGCPVVTPVSAALKGLQALKAKRISVLTPYVPETSRPMAVLFEEQGFAIDRFTCLNMTDDRDMARISPDDIVTFAREATDPKSDALFISCTAVRAAGVIGRIEAETGIAALSSNYAAAWNAARICGVAGALAPGRLMGLPLRRSGSAAAH
jgi:maleate isomerase